MRLDIALLSSLTVPDRRLRIVLLYAMTIVVEPAEVDFGIGVPSFCFSQQFWVDARGWSLRLGQEWEGT